MNAVTHRRIKAAAAAEREAAKNLDAARDKLAAAMLRAINEGATIREVAEVADRAKSQVHREVTR